MPCRNTALANKIELWNAPMRPFETLAERIAGKEAWIASLGMDDLQQLYELLLLTKEELKKIGITDFEDFQFEASCIFGEVGKKNLDQTLNLLKQLIVVNHSRIWAFVAIDELKSEKCYPILIKAWNDFQLNEKELIGLINALEATPGQQSLVLLKTIATTPNLSDAVKSELEIAFQNRKVS